jgi:hypothetical protein
MEGNKNNKSNWLEWVIIIIHKTNLKSNNKIIIIMIIMSNKNLRNKIKTQILQKLLKLTKNNNSINNNNNNNNNKWNNNNLIAKMEFANGCNNTMNNLKVI